MTGDEAAGELERLAEEAQRVQQRLRELARACAELRAALEPPHQSSDTPARKLLSVS